MPLEETTDPANEQGYVTELLACHSCADAERAMTTFRDGGGDTAGVRPFIREREGTS